MIIFKNYYYIEFRFLKLLKLSLYTNLIINSITYRMQDRTSKEFQSNIRGDVVKFNDYTKRIKLYTDAFKSKFKLKGL